MIGARRSLTRSGRLRAAGTPIGIALGATLALAAGLLAPAAATASESSDSVPAVQPLSQESTPVVEPTAEEAQADEAEADETAADEKRADKKKSDKKRSDKKRAEQDRVAKADEPELPPAPVPAVPADLPAVVDPLPGYQGQGICDPTPKSGSLALAQLIKDTYGSLATSVWIPRDCSIGGRSEHKEGRAVDWMINQRIPMQDQAAEAFIDWLLAPDENGNQFAMARRLGVMYIGWGDEIWESYRQGWSELKGCYSTPEPAYDNYCHRNHIHISLSWDGAAARTSFWGGSPTPVPFCPTTYPIPSSEPMSMGRGLDFVATTPRRVLDTRTGSGLASGDPCRLTQKSGGGPGASVALKVADLRGAPRGDIRAVAVRTITIGSNSPAALRALTFAGEPIAPVKIGGRTEATTVIPVGEDGTIAFTTDSGATHLLVDVLGYFVAPASVTAAGTGLTLSDGAVVYDTADDTVLGPREKRVISLNVDGDIPRGALISLTISGGERSGKLIVRPAGTKRTTATPVLSYRRADISTQTLLTKVNDQGEIIVVNRSRGAVDLKVVVEAASLPSSAPGSLVVPVAPTDIDGRQTSLRRVLRDAKGSAGVVLQVDAATTSKSASIRYWSGTATPTVVHVGRKSAQSSLIVVPLTDSALIMREIVGGDVDVRARIVAYLR